MTCTTKKAFTLVELLVVVGIIALLISILLPALNKARQQALAVQCLSNLRQCGNITMLYCSDNKGSYPPALVGYVGSIVWNSPGAYGEYRNVWDYLLRYGLTTNASRSCPASPYELPPDQSSTSTFAAAWTYNYSAVLGGLHYQTPGTPYYSFKTGTFGANTAYYCSPLKLGGFHNPTVTALFTDHADLQTNWANGYFDYWTWMNTPAQATQVFSDTQLLHSVKAKDFTYGTNWGPRQAVSGINNVCFADGHAESCQINLFQQYVTWYTADNMAVQIEPRY